MLQLGWSSAFNCEESIRRAGRWYADNRWWWEPIRAGEFQTYYNRNYGNRAVLKE